MSAKAKDKSRKWCCKGRYASSRFRRWQIGAAVLRYLRIPPIVPCDFGGSRRRPRFEGYRGFRQRKAMREELRQCDGFETDGRRSLCNRRDDNVFQRLLPRLSETRRGFDTLVHSI